MSYAMKQKLQTGDRAKCALAHNDPVMRAHSALKALNTYPKDIVGKLCVSTLSEFAPELWEELQKCTVSQRIIAVSVYESIRRRVELAL